MATSSIPVLGWIAPLAGALGVAQSSLVYFTAQLSSGWEISLPVYVRYSGVSNDNLVNIYPSSDGGNRYDTQPIMSFSIARATGDGRVGSTRLPTGIYLIGVLHAGPQSGLIAILTAQVVSAIQNA